MSFNLIKLFVLIIIGVLTITTTIAYPAQNDQASAASSYNNGIRGRVQIKVYRGPNQQHGHHVYAPWGYWVRLPSDYQLKKRHGRVQVKVYRGPDDHHFTPWGYWFKLPADDSH